MACDNPTQITVKGIQMPVPCNKCPPCKSRRINEWIFRIMWEEEHNSTSSHFVTLTYNTRHVPLTKHGLMTLRKKDVQKYLKRLRKLCPDYTLKYFFCGEYGPQGNRPHYHAIVLNCPDAEYFAKAWSLDGSDFGSVKVGTCTSDSIAYCMKYIDKETMRSKKYRHQRDGREFEFQLCSKGLGKGYTEDPANLAYHRADLSRNYLTKLSGHRVAMPRYYRQRIYTPEQLEQQHYIINAAVDLHDQKRQQRHVQSGAKYSYQQRIEYEKEERRRKHEASIKKRNTL